VFPLHRLVNIHASTRLQRSYGKTQNLPTAAKVFLHTHSVQRVIWRGKDKRGRGQRRAACTVNLIGTNRSAGSSVYYCVVGRCCRRCHTPLGYTVYMHCSKHEPPPPDDGFVNSWKHRSCRRKTCREPDGK